MRKKIVITSISIIFIGIFICAQARNEDDVPSISVDQLKERIDKKEKIVLLDVRTEKEFNGPLGHIEGAILIPLKELDSRINELDSLKNSEFIVYCKSGFRSRRATKTLIENGFTAINLIRGIDAWYKMFKDKVDVNENKKELKVEN